MAAIDQQIAEAIRKLNALGKEFEPKKRKALLRNSGKIMQKAYRSEIPELDEGSEHYRYLTSKVSNRIRAPKGKGKIVATYKRGNLQRAIKVLSFRKSANVFVGPKLLRGDKARGVFDNERKADGFYLWFLEFGTENMAPGNYKSKAVSKAKADVANDITKRVKKVVTDFANRNRV